MPAWIDGGERRGEPVTGHAPYSGNYGTYKGPVTDGKSREPAVHPAAQPSMASTSPR